MRKFLPYIFIFIVLFGIFVPINFTHAQQNPGGDTVTNMVLKGFLGISYLIMQLMSFVLWLSGSLLNLIIEHTIINLKTNIEGMTGINIAWRVIRDLVNISFIFILVYEGIKMIIGLSDTSKAKSVIVGIIVTSILINFSVFFTKVIIDASNVVTIGFYKSINKASSEGEVSIGDNIMKNGISGAFVNALDISSFFDKDNIGNLQGEDTSKLILITLFGSLLFLILSFVFFAIAIMFFVRYVAFLILLVLSPIGFLGFGIPQLKGPQSKWWETLTGQALFAPVYMILTWIVLVLMYSDGFISIKEKGNWGNMLLGKGGMADPGAIAIMINFGIIIALAIFTLTQAKSLASKGAGEIANVTKMITTKAGGALMGGGAALGRNTVGRMGNWAANNEKLKDKAAAGGFWAKQGLKFADRTAKGTYDARNTSTVGWATGQLGMDIGKGGKSNYRSVIEDRGKKEAEFAKLLKPSEEKMKEKEEKEALVKEERRKEKEQKDILESEEFKKEEAKRKADYLKSDSYKNEDVYKNAEKEKVENENKIKKEEEVSSNLEKELKDLEGQLSNSAFLGNKKEIEDKILAKKQEIENQKKEIERVKKEILENNQFAKAREEFEQKWASKEKKDIEAKMNEYKEEADKFEKAKKEIEDLWKSRVGDYANSIEKASAMSRYASSLWSAGGATAGVLAMSTPLGVGAAAVGGATIMATSGVTSKEGRSAIAKKVRSVTEKKKGMTKKERKEKLDQIKKAEEAGDEDKVKKLRNELDEDDKLES